MLKKIFLTISCGLALGGSALAQANNYYDSRLSGSGIYSDPGFQEFVETRDGYLNPRHKPAQAGDLRDAVASTAPASSLTRALKNDKLVFVSVLPKGKNHSTLIAEIQASAGFVLSGERTSRSKKSKRTRIMGWVPAGSLELIRKNPGVAAVRIEKESAMKAARNIF